MARYSRRRGTAAASAGRRIPGRLRSLLLANTAKHRVRPGRPPRLRAPGAGRERRGNLHPAAPPREILRHARLALRGAKSAARQPRADRSPARSGGWSAGGRPPGATWPRGRRGCAPLEPVASAAGTFPGCAASRDPSACAPGPSRRQIGVPAGQFPVAAGGSGASDTLFQSGGSTPSRLCTK